ncbi:hypothetical protein GCM10027341_00580 [Spirosoma knui]
MYVKSIRLKNFQSYYGDDNVLAFSEGLNVVVGSINKGKSKLFDAFYWVLFGDIYITGDNWVNTNLLSPKASFINDRARFLTGPGEHVDVTVELVICHQEGEQLPVDYTFCRMVTAERLTNGASWHDDRAWRVDNSRAEVRFHEGTNLTILDTQVEVEEQLRKLFPREIRNYVWFQGEALDRLIDFSNRNTFEQAIKYISYFPRYVTLSSLIDQATDVIEKERNKKQRAATSNQREYDEQVRKLAERKEELRRLNRELDDLENQRTEASQAQEKAETQLKAYQEFPPLKQKESKAETDFQVARTRIDDEIDRQKSQFQKKWLLKGMAGLMQEARQRMQDYETQRSGNAKYELPADVPAKAYLERMLGEAQCLVCGTDAPAGSPPHTHIQNRIQVQEDFYKQRKDNQELRDSVQQVLSFPDEAIGSLDGIDTQIAESIDRIDEAVQQRNRANEVLQGIQETIGALLQKHHLSDPNQAMTQLSKFTSMSRALTDLETRIGKKKVDITECMAKIKSLESTLNLSGAGSVANVPEKRWYELANFMNGVVGQVKDRAKVEMVGTIEERANTFYQAITKHNRAVDGKISIDKVTYKIARTENDEYTVNSGNTGNFTLMKMCIINAMLALNEEVGGTKYPFIADAPTSNLDDETTIAYINSLASAFGQSIIITKDINQYRFDEVKQNPAVRTIYSLETYSENSSAERFTQYEAYTKAKRVK